MEQQMDPRQTSLLMIGIWLFTEKLVKGVNQVTRALRRNGYSDDEARAIVKAIAETLSATRNSASSGLLEVCASLASAVPIASLEAPAS